MLASEECPEFYDIPLPCSRELWQPLSDIEWQSRYQAHVESSKPKGLQGLTFRDLLTLKHVSGNNELSTGSADREDELSHWCETADELCMLLWMALTIERSQKE
jgi:hypothetical protein